MCPFLRRLRAVPAGAHRGARGVRDPRRADPPPGHRARPAAAAAGGGRADDPRGRLGRRHPRSTGPAGRRRRP
ncbi:hypothetical protein ACRAWF_21285 [Streptomyces sp. L7]